MIYNKKLLLADKYNNPNFNFRCPYCIEGTISVIKEENGFKELKANAHLHQYEGEINGVPKIYENFYSREYKCLNCHKSTIINYHVLSKFGYLFEEVNGYKNIPVPSYIDSYTIKYIFPFVPIIHIPLKASDALRFEINSSFTLYWVDLKSCANKIRSSLELLLDAYKVKRTTLNKKNKRQKLSLDARINILKSKYPNLALSQYMLAIKWIGNIGSHSKGKISKSKVLTAYELLNFLLKKKFDRSEKSLLQRAKEINQTKGK